METRCNLRPAQAKTGVSTSNWLENFRFAIKIIGTNIFSTFKPHRTKVFLTGVALITIVVLFLAVPGFDKEQVLEFIRTLPLGAFISAFLILPLLGAPLSLFLIVAALRFGIVYGSLVSSGCMLFHNFAAYWIARTFLKSRISLLMARFGYKIPHVPDRHHVWFTAAFTGMPGIPYTPRLYLLALTNIPFSLYLGVGWPVYSISNVVYVGLANAAIAVDWPLIIALIVLGLVIVGAFYWMKKRLDQRVRMEEAKSRTTDLDSL